MIKPPQYIPDSISPIPETVAIKHVFDIHYGLRGPIDIGNCPSGRRMFFSTSGGVFEGPDIKGKILPDGVDWILTGTNLVSNVDAGVLMQTDDGVVIMARWLGKVRAEPGVLASITDPDKRGDIAASSVYFRTTPVFETSSEKYSWLMQSTFIASAQFTKEGICYRVMRLK